MLAPTPTRSQERSASEDTVKARTGISIKSNLLWSAAAEPNLAVEIPVGEHVTVGVAAGIKTWPRWLFWDNDLAGNDSHWKNFAVVPQMRYYFSKIYDGWFAGVDFVYTHFNVGNLDLPLGLQKDLRDERQQGDFFGLGLFAGHSWWLGSHLRLEVEAGLAAGYKNAGRYECDHCGERTGDANGIALMPKVGINLAWNLRKRKSAPAPEAVPFVIESKPEPEPQPEPQPIPEYIPQAPQPVEPDRGVIDVLMEANPILVPASEYRPYTPDRILRKEKGALMVYFPMSKSGILRQFEENGNRRDNGPVLDSIIRVTSLILQDTVSRVSKIQIVGLSSVEGGAWRNIPLADARAKALQEYIQERLNVPDSLFETVGGGEAWTEFRDQVNDIYLSGGSAELSREKAESLLNLLDNETDPYRREQLIRADKALFNILKNNLLRDQRNSGYLRIYVDWVPDTAADTINEAIGKIETKQYEEALRLLEPLKDDPRARQAYGTALWYCGRKAEGRAWIEKK